MSETTIEFLKERKGVLATLREYKGYSFNPIPSNIDDFKTRINEKIDFLIAPPAVSKVGDPDYGNLLPIGINKELFEFCRDRFNDVFTNPLNPELKKSFTTLIQDSNANENFFLQGDYLDYLDDLLFLGIWDDGYSNDPLNKHSPLGKFFLSLQKYKGNEPIGIIQAAEQQLTHQHKKNLVNAQNLAKDIYTKFLSFFNKEDNQDFQVQLKCHPIVQLCNCGASTLLSGLPTPAFILMDVKQSEKFSGFAALPHEVGHVLAHTPQGEGLLKAIWDNVKQKLPNHSKHKQFGHVWKAWIEECFADAIAVAVIKESEIFSLAHLFSDEPTFKVRRKPGNKKQIDEHPVKHYRVLLTIAVAEALKITDRVLFSKNGKSFKLFERLKEEWDTISGELNEVDNPEIEFPNPDKTKSPFFIPKDDFSKALPVIANALVNESYNKKNLIEFFDSHYKGLQDSQDDKLEVQLKIQIEKHLKGKARNNIVKRIHKPKRIKP